MEKYTTWRRLSTYSVNRRMILNMADTLTRAAPGILHFGNAEVFANHTSLVLYGSDSSLVYYPLSTFTQPLFPNDTEALEIELLYKEGGDSHSCIAFVVEIRLDHESGESYLSIALQDYGKTKEKVLAIEEALLAAMAPNRNHNSVTYPNDFVPTLVFVGGFVIGLSSLMFAPPPLKILCILLFGGSVYYVTRRFIKGYCDFESRQQKRMEVFLNFLTGAVAIFVVAVALRVL